MTRQVCHVASADDAGKRLDALIAQLGLYKSRAAAVKAIESGKVLLNGKCAAKKTSVVEGCAIVCELDEAQTSTHLLPENIPLDIRYEDEGLIVLSKQAGILTHPTPEIRTNTLVNALLYIYGEEGLCNIQGENDRLGIVHRLDAETSGLMLAAKSDEVGLALMDAISLKQVDRRYISLVHGTIAPETAMIDASIARDSRDRKRMRISDSEDARGAITTFHVLARFDAGKHDIGYTLVECKLFTGRTHQIRVHMEYIKHPVVGDPLYTKNAPKAASASLGLERQFLHSYKLGFENPQTGEQQNFTDTLPPDLDGVLRALEGRGFEATDYGKEVLSTLGYNFDSEKI